MESSGTFFSLSSLLCDEVGEAGFFEDPDENPGIFYSLDNSCFVLEDEEEYIEYLFKQETGFGSQNHHLFASDDHSNSRHWLRSARVDAIDWIFDVSFQCCYSSSCLFNLLLVVLLLKLFLPLINQTQAKFGFKVETAYLSVTYFDRFLSERSIDVSYTTTLFQCFLSDSVDFSFPLMFYLISGFIYRNPNLGLFGYYPWHVYL